MRKATIQRKTKETDIQVILTLDGAGASDIATGIGFLDHMLDHIAVHGLFDLTVKAQGDLQVDLHHTIEDCALALGDAFDKALGDRKGIVRIASAVVPMDEALAQVSIDFCGRPYCVLQATWALPALGELPTTLIEHFFRSFAAASKATLHLRMLEPGDEHHQAEALFKAFGRALDAATQIDPRRADKIPSTKGVL
jgi:imidazoleglycerol-phosphate dehydratase